MKTFALFTPVLVGLLVLGGCVPQARYKEARSALDEEQQAHRSTTQELQKISAKLADVEAALAARERKLEQRSEEIAEKELASNVALQERDEAKQMVEQLRGELGRVGDHLRSFADDKRKLGAALEDAEQRCKRLDDLERRVARRMVAMRDLAILVREPLSAGDLELGAIEGAPSVRIDERALFIGDGAELQPVAQRLASAVARVGKAHPSLQIRIRLRSANDSAATLKLRRFAARLETEGIEPQRIEVAVEPPDVPKQSAEKQSTDAPAKKQSEDNKSAPVENAPADPGPVELTLH